MIEFAAATWKVDQAEALTRLGRDHAAYVSSAEERIAYATLCENRKVLATYWEESRKPRENLRGLPQGIKVLLQQLLFQPDATMEFVGLGVGAELKQLSLGLNVGQLSDGYYVIQPLYTLPGLIAGMHFATHQHGIVRQTVIRHDPRSTQTAYTMPSTLPVATRYLENELVLMPDIWWALRLQQRHMATNIAPLPLMGMHSYNVSLRNSCDWFGNRKRTIVLVFAPETVPPNELAKTILMARSMNARIGWLWDAAPAVPRNISRAAETLRNTITAAVSWRAALIRKLQRMPVDDARAFFQSLPLDAVEQREIVKGCSRLATADTQIVAMAGPLQVVERENGWYTPAGTQLASARVKIHEIIAHDVMRATGVLHCHDTQIPFDVRWSASDASAFANALVVVAASVNANLIISNSIKTKVLAIATQFHQPLTSAAYTRIGWDSLRFRFQDFSISSTGQLEIDENSRYVGSPAAAAVPPPSILGSADIRALNGPCLPLALGLLTNVACSVMSPLIGEQKPRMMITGGTFDASRSILEKFGCNFIPRHSRRYYSHPHDWSALLPWVKKQKHRRQQLYHVVAGDYVNIIMLGNELDADIVQPRGWTILEDDHPQPSDAFLQAARELPASYLHDLARRRFNIPRKENLYETLLVDVVRWWTQETGVVIDDSQIPVRR
jgi:hypothetical protein